MSFNPRTRKGYDTNSTLNQLRCFNPRTRKGYDAFGDLKLLNSSSFNPRTRKGYDF
ncbi:hypothetical protein [Parabacteroides sp. AF18-52]|uniref:hypothetical protein n=1 Tax=Parabacteroides sp. AF18-52 TaxID=2292242 RepID=UPI0013154C37|nr:hypothetical protein [Parabacteroides sp. AF18-52]